MIIPSGPRAGQTMMRPNDPRYDPNRVVAMGEAQRDHRPKLDQVKELGRLFKHNGELDAQRAGGVFDSTYLDYTNMEIGLYGAAAGMDREKVLRIGDIYGQWKSTHAEGTPMDPRYQNTPARNVADIDLGYQLYNSGAFS